MPIWKTADKKTGVLDAVTSVEKVLKTARIKVKVDDSEQRTPGWKFNFWEMKVWHVCFLYVNKEWMHNAWTFDVLTM